jgi:hypothetical protein
MRKAALSLYAFIIPQHILLPRREGNQSVGGFEINLNVEGSIQSSIRSQWAIRRAEIVDTHNWIFHTYVEITPEVYFF